MFRPDEDGLHDGDGGGHVFRWKSFRLAMFLSKILIRRGNFWWIRSFTDGHERRGTGAECGEGDGAGWRNLWDLHGHRNWN